MAADGVEGLEVLDQEEIHLAIVDIMMPRMDGITMTMKLREKHDFPVIMLSAKSEEVDKVMGLNIGGRRLCDKAFHSHGTDGKSEFPDAPLPEIHGKTPEKEAQNRIRSIPSAVWKSMKAPLKSG